MCLQNSQKHLFYDEIGLFHVLFTTLQVHFMYGYDFSTELT